LQLVKDRADPSPVIKFNLEELQKFSEQGADLVERIEGNAKRYVEIICSGVDEMLADETLLPTNFELLREREDVIDILQRQRIETDERNRQRQRNEGGEEGGLEAEEQNKQAFPR